VSIGRHWSLDGLCLVHVKLLKHITCALGLTYKRPFICLFDLKSKKELELTHHGHFKPLLHDPTKLFTKSFISTTKYYVIDIYLAHKDMTTNFSSKESSMGFAYLKALLEKEILKAFIPCSWCLLETIERLTEFVHMIRMLGIFKPSGCST
jgi:hypothetical protein